MEHKTRTKALSLLLSLALMLSLMPGMSLTALAAGIGYLDASGTLATCNSYTTVNSSTQTVTWNSGWYVVSSTVTISDTVTLNGSVNLILCDSKGLSVVISGEGGKAGISGTGSLTVYGQSGGTGALTVSGGDFGTSHDNPGGIGVNATLTVNGGTVTVNGGKGGEWSGYGGHGGPGVNGTLTVNGGTVTVNGGNGGDDRYSGNNGGNGVSGTLTVNGGMVTLTGGGGHGGPGIQGNPDGVGVNGTLTLGAQMILYEGTNTTGTVLDGSTGSSRVYSGEKKRSIHAEVDPHTHNFTSYSADGATITATCTADGCRLPPSAEGATDHVATLTIGAPLHTNVGDGKSEAATLPGLADFNAATCKNIAATDIKYAGRDGTTYAENATAPTAEGKYTAKITVESMIY